MYGFIYEVLDENHVLAKPFWEDELVSVWGTCEQMEEIRLTLRKREKEENQEPLILVFNEEERMLEEDDIFHEFLAG